MSQTTLERPAISTGIAEYDGIAAGLATLRDRYQGVRFEVETTAGDKQARTARKELVNLRVAIEAKRVELKAPALERSRLIDSIAKQITAEIASIEEPIDAQIKAHEERKEAERKAKAKAEADRVAAIQARITKIREIPGRAPRDSAGIEALIADLKTRQIGIEFAEFQEVARAALDITLSSLEELASVARSFEEQEARLAAGRIELAKQQAEQEARDKEARQKIEAERKAEDERRKAEQKAEDDRIADERKAHDDKLAAERAEFKRQQDQARAEQAEREANAEREQRRIDAERAELKRQQDAAKAKADAEARAFEEAQNRAANRLRDAAPDLLEVLTHPDLDRLIELIGKGVQPDYDMMAEWLVLRDAAIVKATGNA